MHVVTKTYHCKNRHSNLHSEQPKNGRKLYEGHKTSGENRYAVQKKSTLHNATWKATQAGGSREQVSRQFS